MASVSLMQAGVIMGMLLSFFPPEIQSLGPLVQLTEYASRALHDSHYQEFLSEGSVIKTNLSHLQESKNSFIYIILNILILIHVIKKQQDYQEGNLGAWCILKDGNKMLRSRKISICREHIPEDKNRESISIQRIYVITFW